MPELLSGLTLRPLTPVDLESVMDIERQGYSHPWSEGVFSSCFREDYRLWALEKEGRLAGYAVVAYLFDEAHLLNICVAPALQGCGAGRLLLRYLASEALRDGMVKVLLEVRKSNEVARALYRSEHFVEIGERPAYYPAGQGREDATVMELPLVATGDSGRVRS